MSFIKHNGSEIAGDSIKKSVATPTQATESAYDETENENSDEARFEYIKHIVNTSKLSKETGIIFFNDWINLSFPDMTQAPHINCKRDICGHY